MTSRIPFRFGVGAIAATVLAAAFAFGGHRVSFVDSRVPLSPGEQARAHTLATRDAGVRRMIGAQRHEHAVLAYPMYPDNGVCAVDRCASVVFQLGAMRVSGIGREIDVLIDLDSARVIERSAIACDESECHARW